MSMGNPLGRNAFRLSGPILKHVKRMDSDDERRAPQADANKRLWHGLENCRRMVADYRERLERHAAAQGKEEPGHRVPDEEFRDAPRLDKADD